MNTFCFAQLHNLLNVLFFLAVFATCATKQAMSESCTNFLAVPSWTGTFSVRATGSGTVSNSHSYNINLAVTGNPVLDNRGVVFVSGGVGQADWFGAENVAFNFSHSTVQLADSTQTAQSSASGTLAYAVDQSLNPTTNGAVLSIFPVSATQCAYSIQLFVGFPSTTVISSPPNPPLSVTSYVSWTPGSQLGLGGPGFFLGEIAWITQPGGDHSVPLPGSGLGLQGSATLVDFFARTGEQVTYTMEWCLTPAGSGSSCGSAGAITAAVRLSTGSKATDFFTPFSVTSGLGPNLLRTISDLNFVADCLDSITEAIVHNCDLNVAISPIVGVGTSAGHDHDNVNRPIGGIYPGSSGTLEKSIMGETGSSGFAFGYRADEISGDVKGEITGRSSGAAILPSTFVIHVGFPDLEELPSASTDYVLTGQVPGKHESNHFVQQTLRTQLQLLAIAYHIRFPNDPILPINDTSLELGGLFDLAGNWLTVPKGHKLHRFGIDADVGSGGGKKMTYWVPIANRKDFLHLITGVGLRAISEQDQKCDPQGDSQPCNHWHLLR